jgi:hypothetical protein
MPHIGTEGAYNSTSLHLSVVAQCRSELDRFANTYSLSEVLRHIPKDHGRRTGLLKTTGCFVIMFSYPESTECGLYKK